MTARRELSAMLADVGDAALVAAGDTGVRTTSMELVLPVDVAVEMRDGAATVLADVPLFVFRCAFDRPPSRVRVVWSDGGDA